MNGLQQTAIEELEGIINKIKNGEYGTGDDFSNEACMRDIEERLEFIC